MEIIKAFFQNWDRIHNVTLKLIQQVPEDKLDFKPTEKNFTLRELIHHIYNAEETITVMGKENEAADQTSSSSRQSILEAAFPLPEAKDWSRFLPRFFPGCRTGLPPGRPPTPRRSPALRGS